MSAIRSCTIFGLLVLTAFFAAGAIARWNPSPRLEISPEFHVGELVHDQELKLAVGFRNGGTGVLHVDPPIPGCKCALAELDHQDYAPGEMGVFRFTLRPAQGPGTEYAQSVAVPSNDSRQPRTIITIRGKMRDALSSQPKSIRAVDVNVGDGWQRRFAVHCTDPKAKFKITSVACDLPDTTVIVDTNESADGRPWIVVSQFTTNRVGAALGKVVIQTDHVRFRELIVPVEVVVCSRLTISPSMLLFRAGSADKAQTVQITAETPMEVAIDAETYPNWSVQLEPDETRCRWTLHVRRASERPISAVVRETLMLSVAGIDREDQLTIPVTVIPSTESTVADASNSP